MFVEIFLAHPIVGSYLALINVLTLVVYGADKLFAVGHAERVSERTLLCLALVGGSVGAMVAMGLFRHKTRKISFLLLLSIVLVAQLSAIYLWLSANGIRLDATF